MAITHFLLQSNFNFVQQTTKCPYYSPGGGIKGSGIHGVVIWRSLEKALLSTGDHRFAMAASGGRMGGRSFSSSSRNSTSRYRSRPSGHYSSSKSSSLEGYSTQIGSPALMKAGNHEEVKPMNFMTYCVCLCLLYIFTKWCDGDLAISKTSVLKLQVGLLGTGGSLQMDLNRIAKVANSKGLRFVLQESILALLRHPDYSVSGYSSVDVKSKVTGCEKLFDQLSIEERGKFDEETLDNANSIGKKSATSQGSNGLRNNEYMVVTIIVAARGVLELPPIKSGAQLNEALQKLASISSTDIMGVEVLWTPQKEDDDSLTEQEMLEDYPLLHPL